MTQKNPYLSIIIPSYNEAENIKRGNLDIVLNYFLVQKYSWELILVNDGSSDQTSKLFHAFAAKHTSIRVLDNLHQGKAVSIMTGAAAAMGDYIIFTDTDQATPVEETSKLIAGFNSGADIVIGSRSGRRGAPFFRKVLAYGNIIIRTLILRLPFKDTQCGFKGFSRTASEKIFTIMFQVHPPKVITGPAVNAGFDMELLYLGRKLRYKILEIPVTWRHQETKRVSFLRDAVASIRELLLVRWRSLINAYKLKS